jgi:hypothetical protein
MRRFALAVFAASMLFGNEPFTQMKTLPSLGSRIDVPGLPDSTGLCMVSPGQMDKCAKVEVAGVQYSVAFRKKGWLRKPVVTYIHTSDPKFLSPSGKRVGDFLEVNFTQIVRAPGFEMYGGGPIRGWTAVVGFNGKLTTGSSVEESVELDSLRDQSGPLRLRITGFTAR